MVFWQSYFELHSDTCLYHQLPVSTGHSHLRTWGKLVLNKSPLTPCVTSLYLCCPHNKTVWNNFLLLWPHFLVAYSLVSVLWLGLCSHCSTEIATIRVSWFAKSSCHLSVLTLPDLSGSIRYRWLLSPFETLSSVSFHDTILVLDLFL